MVTRKDYIAEAVEAAYSVLIELMHALGEYREQIVLVGGWVPGILLAFIIKNGTIDATRTFTESLPPLGSSP
jgi:hypothetical protein